MQKQINERRRKICRLLGVIANKPVDLEFSLERFKKFASRNHDGWGIGWYDGEKLQIFKQGVSATSKEVFKCHRKEN